jgi:hypothetical protein
MSPDETPPEPHDIGGEPTDTPVPASEEGQMNCNAFEQPTLDRIIESASDD